MRAPTAPADNKAYRGHKLRAGITVEIAEVAGRLRGQVAAVGQKRAEVADASAKETGSPWQNYMRLGMGRI